MSYGRDTDIGRPDDGLDLKKAALALQILIDESLDDVAMGAPEDEGS